MHHGILLHVVNVFPIDVQHRTGWLTRRVIRFVIAFPTHFIKSEVVRRHRKFLIALTRYMIAVHDFMVHALALIDDLVHGTLRIDVCRFRIFVGYHDHFARPAIIIIGPDLILDTTVKDLCSTQLAAQLIDTLLQTVIELTDRMPAEDPRFDFRTRRFFDAQKDIECIAAKFLQGYFEAGYIAVGQRRRVPGHKLFAVELRKATCRSEDITCERQVQHFLDHDAMHHLTGSLIVVRLQGIYGTQIGRDSGQFHFHRDPQVVPELFLGFNFPFQLQNLVAHDQFLCGTYYGRSCSMLSPAQIASADAVKVGFEVPSVGMFPHPTRYRFS